jgi:hypothetical protein
MAERLLIRLAAPLVALLALSGCTAEPTSQAPAPSRGGAPAVSGGAAPVGHAPVVTSARIFPVDVSLDTTLRVEVRGEGMSGGPITYRYQWFVNNLPIQGATEPQFSTESLKKDDRIRVTVTPNDGKMDGPVFETDPVTVGNTAPEIAEIHLEPVPLHRGEQLKVTVVAGDAEGDPITLSYKWFRNDKVIPDAKTDTLDAKDFRKKDVLAVLVIPSDGKATREGHAGLPVTIVNSPPSFTSTPPAGIALVVPKDGSPAREGTYEYAVTAVDPDEDPVTFELKQAPPGMTIDAATGKITWKLTVENAGKHKVVIAAKDNDNEVTQQEFDLDIPLAQPAAQQ